MKSLVVVLLVVLSATSSLTAASDTLRVISYRTVDMCSNEKTWLIAFSIGEVYASDSLQSFDITVGFDTSQITPTDLLISGTLADQMRFGDLSPFMRTAVPGELRVGGFTVTRNVRGDLPLVAVTGSYKGACGDADTFYLAYNPNSGFNGEFKGEITTFISDSIVAVANSIDDPSQGPTWGSDSVLINGRDSTGSILITVDQSRLAGAEIMETISIQDPDLFEIDSILTEGVDSIRISAGRQAARVYRTVSSEGVFEYRLQLRSINEAHDTATVVGIQTNMVSDCGCVTPTRTDELFLQSQHTTTSVEQRVVHESTDLTIRYISNTLELQCSHGQPWTVMVVDLVGRIAAQTQVVTGTNSRLSLSPLPKGMYIVYATNGRKSQGMTIAK